MDLLEASEREILRDYEARLSGAKQSKQNSAQKNNPNGNQILRRSSNRSNTQQQQENLKTNEDRSQHYYHSETDDNMNNQEEDRPMVFLPNRAAQNRQRQSAFLTAKENATTTSTQNAAVAHSSHHRVPLGGKSPAEYVNDRIKRRMDFSCEDSEEERQSNEWKPSRNDPRDSIAKQFVQQGRLSIPSIAVFMSNPTPSQANTKNNQQQNQQQQQQRSFDERDPQQLAAIRRVDVCEIVTTKHPGAALAAGLQKIGRVTSSELSTRIEAALQKAAFADRMLEEKQRIFTNITHSNVPLNKSEIIDLFEQLLPSSSSNNNNNNNISISRTNHFGTETGIQTQNNTFKNLGNPNSNINMYAQQSSVITGAAPQNQRDEANQSISFKLLQSQDGNHNLGANGGEQIFQQPEKILTNVFANSVSSKKVDDPNITTQKKSQLDKSTSKRSESKKKMATTKTTPVPSKQASFISKNTSNKSSSTVGTKKKLPVVGKK